MLPTVAEWLNGKDILITGATGFLGKVLVEKLLRCCPGVGKLYLIIRPKRGVDPEERIREYAQNELFEKLLQDNPKAFDKIIGIPGDISALKCGLSEKNQQVLMENVSVVFHSAASIRFNESLSDALKQNTRGTYELMKIVKGMRKLEIFLYVSTTYCNANLNEPIHEKVYPSHLDWKVLLKLLDKDEDSLNWVVNKLISTHPNTYTLSKSLAENVVLEMSEGIPTVICRPSLVMPTLKEPIPGWTDNLNGLLATFVGMGKGILRTFKCRKAAVMDMIPVDGSINGIITAAWYKRFNDGEELIVVNQTAADQYPMSLGTLQEHFDEVISNYPMENYCWYPFIIFTNNNYYYHFLFLFLQLIPALLQDLLFTLAGRKRMFLKINMKIYIATMATCAFGIRPFTFIAKNHESIESKLHPNDRKTYFTNRKHLDQDVNLRDMMTDTQRGIKKYIFHEKEEDLSTYRTIHKRLYILHMTAKVVILTVGFWIAVKLASVLFRQSTVLS